MSIVSVGASTSDLNPSGRKIPLPKDLARIIHQPFFDEGVDQANGPQSCCSKRIALVASTGCAQGPTPLGDITGGGQMRRVGVVAHTVVAAEAQMERLARLQAYWGLTRDTRGRVLLVDSAAKDDIGRRRSPEAAYWPARSGRAAPEGASGAMARPGLAVRRGFRSFRRRVCQGRAAFHNFDRGLLASHVSGLSKTYQGGDGGRPGHPPLVRHRDQHRDPRRTRFQRRCSPERRARAIAPPFARDAAARSP